ncbi:SDR family oxidoreductase [Spirosoma utsteinense]|uniref:Oxidoreductase n=1 Tax=Spirosoma utsteinense TaxID=2585773 RepID=A0ABR6W492_9BACT|nr:SDR family NAD(P)-dependent oxidoreductase [Spirosoma utsteinense]MBC3786365.1 putative oxidoreductase [Spirosoma utsteinense]MBC3791414.1 putative oxidoreductase [Spirosoma utsteinense]
MDITTNTVLITGGASGIGWALAERFLKAGSQVIICGRRADKLQEAQQQYPQLHIRQCDVGLAADRVALLDWVSTEFPQVNVLINNAGIQRRMQLTNSQEDWTESQSELAINLEAPLHLSMLFIPHLRQHPKAAIMNVTSGLAFVPGSFAPIYSATKAALHSFTMSLRHQLSGTSIEVIELVPPAVNTDLGGTGLHNFGVPVGDFADAMMAGIEAGSPEIGYGTSETNRLASREQVDAIFRQMNSRF